MKQLVFIALVYCRNCIATNYNIYTLDTVIHSFVHLPIYLFILPFIRSVTHSFVHSFFQLGF